MDFSLYKGNGIIDKEIEDELMKFTTKSDSYGVQGPLVKQMKEVEKNSDVEVNITECTKPMANKNPPVAAKYQDTTEGSSSFDDSESDFENVDTLGDSEATSDFFGDPASALDFDGFGENFRKKKLTNHWRSFIQPIMWRCKWTELQIKKLQSLARKYDRELEAHNKQKQIELDNTTLIDGVKSIPFSHMNARSDVVKRKKRRMTEATTDVKAYMSRHNLFQYYENEKCFAEGTLTSNFSKLSAAQKASNDDEFWADDDLLSFAGGDDDDSLENILQKIEFLQSKAGRLKSRVDMVLSENAEKIFYAENLSLPMPFEYEASHANNGDGMGVGTYIASQLISEYNMSDILGSESEVTNHDDGVHNSNENIDHACIADAYKNVEDGVLIDNQRVKEEMNSIDEAMINPIQRPSFNASSSILEETDLPIDNQSPQKVRPIAKITGPRSKRKRGRKRVARRKPRRSTG